MSLSLNEQRERNGRRSKFDVTIVFADNEDSTCAVYHRYFRDMRRTRVEKMEVMQGDDCLVIPLPSCFGLYSEKSGTVHKIMDDPFLFEFLHSVDIDLSQRTMGKSLAVKIQNHVLRKYLGEQPLGSAFILKNPNKQSKFRFVIVVALFRALTCVGDDMAWLDPQYVTKDFAYNALRGVLLTLLRHNAVSKKNKISTVYCPDFFRIRKEAPGGDKVPAHELDETVRQMLMAIRGIFEPSRSNKNWADAILITTQIISSQENKEDLETMLDTGKLETRGLYSHEELDKVVSWARDSKNKARQEAAIKVLASCLHRSDTQFNLPKQDISQRISGMRDGCLPLIIDMVLAGKITVHNEIAVEELTIGEDIGDGTAGSVFRGVWGDKHVAIKKFRNDAIYEEFIKELSIMCIVQHKNLVKCYGGVTKNNKKWIVAELMQTNLSRLLLEKSIHLDLGIITEIAMNAIEGIDYLHTHCNLIHRDIKSMNLLINTYKTHLDVKVCDFGVSRLISKKQIMTGNVGTVAWIAPEVFEGKKYNEKADIYSFGVILWELVTRQIPFAEKSSFAIPVSVINGERPPLPKSCPPSLYKLIRRPKQRPSTTKIMSMLQKFHKRLPLNEKAQVSINITNLFELSSSTDNSIRSTPTITVSGSGGAPSISSGSSDKTGSPAPSCAASEIDESDLLEKSAEYEDAPFHPATCNVPGKWATPIAQLEISINNHFSLLKQNSSGAITVGEEDRYILCRASGLAKDFVEALLSLYEFSSRKDAVIFMRSFIYYLGFVVGHNEAQYFISNSAGMDPILSNNASLIFSAYTGMAYVQLLPNSVFNDDAPEQSIILTENAYSFEGESWRQSNLDFCMCNMHSGFLSGWGTVATGAPRTTVELFCTAKGDNHCVFFDSHNILLEKNLQNHCTANNFQYPDISKYVDPDHKWFSSTVGSVLKLPQKNPSSVAEYQKFLSEPEVSQQDIERRLSRKMETMFIDPTTATVELAEEKCILIRGDALACGMYALSRDLYAHIKKQVPHQDITFASKFLYIFARCLGRSNCAWFGNLLGLGKHPISKLMALPSSVTYMGWSTLEFRDGLNDLRGDKKDKFCIKCRVEFSFEALSWLQKSSEKLPKSPKRDIQDSDSGEPADNVRDGTKTSCIIHAGYLAGWFEATLNIPILAVETKCTVAGHKYCEFYVGPLEHMKAKYPHQSDPINTSTTFLHESLLNSEEKRKYLQKKPRRRSMSSSVV